MRMLITEQHPGAAATVAQRLGAAGHELVYCHQPEVRSESTSDFCSAATIGRRCPLADNDVAVIVDARLDSGPMSVREFGVICAVRHGTPLVVAGPVPGRQLWPWRDADVRCAVDDVVAAFVTSDRALTGAVREAIRAAVRGSLVAYSADWQFAHVYFHP